MSLEAALDEERREILKILEGSTEKRRRSGPGGSYLSDNERAGSPLGTRSPVRSMLDVGPNTSTGRRASIAGSGVGITNSTYRSSQAPIRSMLDPVREGISTSSRKSSNQSPPEISPTGDSHFRDGSADQHRFSPNSEYQFDMLPANPANALPKRASQGGKKQSGRQNTISSLLGNGGRETERGRHHSISGTGIGQNQSKSPSSRFGKSGRSQSPRNPRLNSNSYNLMGDPGKFVGERGQVIDMNSAYRRLSDAALARSGGSLSALPARAGSEHIRAGSGEMLSPTGGIRLEKDFDDGDEEALAESSDDGARSSDDEFYGRGRQRDESLTGSRGIDVDDDSDGDGLTSIKDKSKSRVPRSLLAAAEDERLKISANYKVKSLLGPDLTVTGPGGEKIGPKKAGVHPLNNFDHISGSGVSTPMTTDTEADISDIKRAIRLNINTSPISSTPESHRCVRTIIRGEFGEMQREAEEGLRRQRTYLVATDLSEQAAHALEWTIGTVLRDGDTVMAIFAIDEEAGLGDSSGVSQGVEVGGAAHAFKDHTQVIGQLTKKSVSGLNARNASSPLAGGISATPSPDGRVRSKAESERFHAVEEISQRIVRLLRKTRLQVRVVVEVLHCKSPRHLLCEVIDFIEPTLVVLGSRGRSAVQTVLLGSFSNYLVQKSSVPVMVARKRLRKSKYKKMNTRQPNNLTSPSSERLASAKID